MKKSASIITILSICCSSLFSQDTASSVYDFICAHLDEKVGTGVCMDFIIQAENQKYDNWYKDYYLKEDSMISHQIDLDSARLGDIIILRDIVLDDSVKINEHIGFTGTKFGNKIAIISQNSGHGKTKTIKYHGRKVKVLKDSKVEYEELDLDKIISGHIYVFRF